MMASARLARDPRVPRVSSKRLLASPPSLLEQPLSGAIRKQNGFRTRSRVARVVPQLFLGDSERDFIKASDEIEREHLRVVDHDPHDRSVSRGSDLNRRQRVDFGVDRWGTNS